MKSLITDALQNTKGMYSTYNLRDKWKQPVLEFAFESLVKPTSIFALEMADILEMESMEKRDICPFQISMLGNKG